MGERKRHHRIVWMLSLATVLMFGFGFAMVPIYNRMCQVLGINGKPNMLAVAYDEKKAGIEKNRMVTVQFVATQNATLPWLFYPEIKTVDIHPGAMTKLTFYAENQSDHAMVVQAIPSITPGLAAKYLKKTECFCFTQQTLNPHEAMHMPILFHLDPGLPVSIRTITLSYTLFDVTNRVHS